MEQKKMVSMRLKPELIESCMYDLHYLGVPANKTETVETALLLLLQVLDNAKYGSDLQKESALLDLHSVTGSPVIRDRYRKIRDQILDHARN